jgi:DNA polymerase V
MRLDGVRVRGEIDLIFAHGGETALELPLAGSPVHAGFAELSEGWVEAQIDFNRDFIRNPDTTLYARIVSDSMEPVIQDGAFVVYDTSLEWTHGSLVVAIIDGGYVAKRYWRTACGIELRSHNPDYKPIVITEEMDCRIHGKIIAVIQVF